MDMEIKIKYSRNIVGGNRASGVDVILTIGEKLAENNVLQKRYI